MNGSVLTPVRLGFVGVNTWHAEAFSDILVGNGPAAHVGPLPEVVLAAVWGEPADARRAIAAKTGARELVGDPRQMLGLVDLAYIIDDDGGGARHRELAEPFIEAGVPVFIDKPMALTMHDARALIELARVHRTPLMSGSALRFSTELAEKRDEIAALGPIRSVTVAGPGEWYYYGIHAVELLLAAVDSSVLWVSRVATDEQDVAILGLDDQRLAIVQVLRRAFYTFTITLYGTEGWLSFDITKNYEFYRAQIRAAAEMARTGRSPVPDDHMLTVLRVLHAGVVSERDQRRVTLSELPE